jgi:hypothetical protein
MATIVRKEKRQRSFFGNFIKWAFIGFNVLMLVWVISGINTVSGLKADSEAARVGHAIGATIGFGMILGLWVMGDIILGLFVLLTRGDKIIVEETAYAPSTVNELDAPSTADEMISRYVQREHAPSTPRVPSRPAQAGFGRRR